MNEPFDLFQESVEWVADTGFFIACGRQQNKIGGWDISLSLPKRSVPNSVTAATRGAAV